MDDTKDLLGVSLDWMIDGPIHHNQVDFPTNHHVSAAIIRLLQTAAPGGYVGGEGVRHLTKSDLRHLYPVLKNTSRKCLQ